MEIDLYPREWKSERPKPAEPFFGEGLPGMLAYLIGYALSATAIYFLLHH